MILKGQKYDLRVTWVLSWGTIAQVELIDRTTGATADSWSWTVDLATWTLVLPFVETAKKYLKGKL